MGCDGQKIAAMHFVWTEWNESESICAAPHVWVQSRKNTCDAVQRGAATHVYGIDPQRMALELSCFYGSAVALFLSDMLCRFQYLRKS